MLELSHIRENRQEIIDALKKRFIDAESSINDIIALDDKRKHAQFTLDQNLMRQKK